MKAAKTGGPVTGTGNATPKDLRFAQLSPARQQLVRLFQTVNYGRIQGLVLRDGDPVFEPPPVVITDVKLYRDDGPRPELVLADFELRTDLLRLMARLDQAGNGVVHRIEVRAGMPCRVVLESHLTGVE